MKLSKYTAKKELGGGAEYYSRKCLIFMSVYLQALGQTGDYDVATQLLRGVLYKSCDDFAITYDSEKHPKELVFLRNAKLYHIPIKRSSIASLIDIMTEEYAKKDEKANEEDDEAEY